MKKIIQILLLFVLAMVMPVFAFAQCAKNSQQEWKVEDKEKSDFTLKKDVKFKIALSHDQTSAMAKTGDYVQFTVLENVYGILCEVTKDKDNNYKPTDNDGKRIIVIPEKTKIFGIVDYAQSRYPFYVKGKAKLFIFVNSVTLESGVIIPIQFAIPEGDFFANLTPAQRRKIVRKCKTDPLKECITGRRAKLQLNTAIIAGVAGTIAAIVKDSTNGGIVASFTLLQSLSAGANDLVNGPNAELPKEKSIYEVETTDVVKGFIMKPKEK